VQVGWQGTTLIDAEDLVGLVAVWLIVFVILFVVVVVEDAEGLMVDTFWLAVVDPFWVKMLSSQTRNWLYMTRTRLLDGGVLVEERGVVCWVRVAVDVPVVVLFVPPRVNKASVLSVRWVEYVVLTVVVVDCAVLDRQKNTRAWNMKWKNYIMLSWLL
jgi:hypothetical protein